jgi:hypothetical protein
MSVLSPDGHTAFLMPVVVYKRYKFTRLQTAQLHCLCVSSIVACFLSVHMISEYSILSNDLNCISILPKDVVVNKSTFFLLTQKRDVRHRYDTN